jgi:hypothetical protein
MSFQVDLHYGVTTPVLQSRRSLRYCGNGQGTSRFDYERAGYSSVPQDITSALENEMSLTTETSAILLMIRASIERSVGDDCSSLSTTL